MSEQREEMGFRAPLTVEIETSERHFASLDELEAFFKQERSAWSWLQTTLADAWNAYHSKTQQLPAAISEARHAQAADGSLSPGQEDALRSVLQNAYSGLFTSESPKGKFLLSIENKERASAAAALFLGALRSRQYTGLQLAGVIDAVLFEKGIQVEAARAAKEAYDEQLGRGVSELANLREEHATLLDDLADLKQRAEKQLEDESLQHRELLAKHREHFEEVAIGIETDLDALKNTYEAEIATRAPGQYWSSKQKAHRRLAWAFGGLFFCGLAATVLSFIWLARWYVDLEQGKPVENLAQVAMLLVIVTPFLWGLRVFARALLSNMHLSADAAERKVMVSTYRALVRRKLADQKDLNLVLAALFRPATTGMVRDDAVPPGLLEQIKDKL